MYTRYLAPSDYGVLELLDLTIFFAGIFAVMGIHSAVFRFYTAYESEQEKKEVISSALFFVAVVSFLVAMVIFSLATPLSLLILGGASYAPLLRAVSLTLFFANLAEVPLAYLRAQHRTVLFVGIGLVRTLLSALVLGVAVVVV